MMRSWFNATDRMVTLSFKLQGKTTTRSIPSRTLFSCNDATTVGAATALAAATAGLFVAVSPDVQPFQPY
jgi:hypothetical protein